MTVIEKLQRKLRRNELAIEAIGMMGWNSGIDRTIKSQRIHILKQENCDIQEEIRRLSVAR